jgi:hypothetical protein
VVASCTGQPNFKPCETITSPDRSYDICSGGTCVSPGCGTAACNAPGPGFPLADTNQRTCYDYSTALASCPGGIPPGAECDTTAFCGQDAQYGWDTTHAATERFTRTGTTEPIVTDTVTGLVWQGCSRGQTGSACGTGTATTANWSTALSYCDGLTWGGFSDWRLPDRYELDSIVDHGRSGPPYIDTAAFPATVPSGYWTSSSYAGGGSYAWYVSFNPGSVNYADKAGATYVRCVRRGPADVPVPRFTRTEPIAGFPVVADAVTGLIWQGCAAGQTGTSCSGTASTHSWQAALDYCQDSTWAGFSDWYLPSRFELSSIVDDTGTSPSIDTTALPATPASLFWSSSSRAVAASYAWYVAFNYGGAAHSAKTSAHSVRCVRRGP